ncbi:MAG: DUF6569 family protein [Ginsengibacter sp.]
MKQILSIIALALPLFSLSQYTYKNLHVDYDEAAIAKNYTYEKLRLYPVYANENFKTEFRSLGKYLTLQDAIAKNKVKITEKTNGGSVNDLTIENISADTIIIISGDIVKGGKQDRIIENDKLLKPKSGKQNLQVFCVESGRWTAGVSGRSSRYPSEDKAAEFKGYYNKGSMSLRKVVTKEKDQSKVWAKVDEINGANKTTTATKTYTALTNSADFNKKLSDYLLFFKNKFANEQNVIGVVIVSGNKVLGCDMFATHDLFSKQFESLLHSYATEAIINGKTAVAAPAIVKMYMDKLLNSESMQEATLKEKGNSFSEKGKKLKVSSFD